MTTIYKHATGTSRIEAVKRWDGGTDIMMTCGIGTTHEEMMRHPLPIHECDRFGAALCKDMINNYTGHNSDLKDKLADSENIVRGVRYDNATLRDEKAELESRIHDLRDHVRERNPTMNDCIAEHNQHADQLCARIEYLEAVNKGLKGDLSNIRVTNTLHKEQWDERSGELDDCKKAFFDLLDQRTEYQNTLRIERVDHIAEKHAINQIHHNIHRSNNSIIKELDAANRGLESDISNLRMSNALYRKRWNEHETESASPESYGMRSRNFERMVKGYHGKLSRHGKTIIITLPFEHESVARNAEKYIVGLED